MPTDPALGALVAQQYAAYQQSLPALESEIVAIGQFGPQFAAISQQADSLVGMLAADETFLMLAAQKVGIM